MAETSMRIVAYIYQGRPGGIARARSKAFRIWRQEKYVLILA
jgi:hypothetical protein